MLVTKFLFPNNSIFCKKDRKRDILINQVKSTKNEKLY